MRVAHKLLIRRSLPRRTEICMKISGISIWYVRIAIPIVRDALQPEEICDSDPTATAVGNQHICRSTRPATAEISGVRLWYVRRLLFPSYEIRYKSEEICDSDPTATAVGNQHICRSTRPATALDSGESVCHVRMLLFPSCEIRYKSEEICDSGYPPQLPWASSIYVEALALRLH